MGQYYYIVNHLKKEFLHPHKFDDGLKLMEFANSTKGTLLGLTILLANGNGKGGGDLDSKDPLVGSWAGDPIVVAGDYGDPLKFIPEDDLMKYRQLHRESNPNLYHVAKEFYEDISGRVIKALRDAGEEVSSDEKYKQQKEA